MSEEKRFVADIPRLLKEWAWEKNTAYSPSTLTLGSGKRVWWKCAHGHLWDDTVLHRSRGRNCPYCSNHRILAGYNNLFATNPELKEQWDYVRNASIDPATITNGSHARAWWICPEGHSYASVIRERADGAGCPYCSNRKILEGYNDLATIAPEIAAEWDYEKNEDVLPTQVGAGSSKKVWWCCSNGHHWSASIVHRVRGEGCPFCGNRKVFSGYNDLATVHPELAYEWNYVKNGELWPEHCLPGSNKKVWWICSQGHEWEASILNRHHGSNCPICAHQKVQIGYNDLATVNPVLAAQWHPTKNGMLSPQDVVAGTNRKVWWLGACGHEWLAPIGARNYGQGCPICFKGKRISFQEKSIFYYVKKHFDDVQENVRLPFLGSLEIDVYIPSIKTGIEYDGDHWHTDLEKDQRKDELCQSNDIRLYHLREPACPQHSKSTWITLADYRRETLSMAIAELLSRLTGKSIYSFDVDVHRDRIEIFHMLFLNVKENSLAALYPDIASQWHSIRNGQLRPDMFAPGSQKSVWWLGECGHEWEATIYSRVSGSNCPYCSNRRLLKGYNDLETTNPELIAEWDWERNGLLSPSDVFAGSEIDVWWKCSKGHSWQAYPYRRKSGAGCPICSNQQVLIGYNDLQTTHEELCKEWDYAKNGELTPQHVVAGSAQNVWWKCSVCGHEWQALVATRAKGAGCKKCANAQLGPKLSKSKLARNGSLHDHFPALAKEWMYDRNGELTPETVTARNNKKVWWKCSICSHEWEATINNRSKNHGCPACAKLRVQKLKRQTELKLRGSLLKNRPDLAAEWDCERNSCTPDEVFANARDKHWWTCPKGHSYEASPNNRMHGRGCPYCSNHKVLVGFNDLATTHPNLIAEWNYPRNSDISPQNITAGSDKKVWWRCLKCGYEWESQIYHRTHGTGCPVCSKGRKR